MTGPCICNFRPHRSDGKMRLIAADGVVWSVCMLAMFVSPEKMAEPIKMPFGGLTWVGPTNYVADGVDIPHGRGNFWGLESIGILLWCIQQKGSFSIY